MEIDYAVAFMTFLVFAVIAVAMYINTFSIDASIDLGAAADRINEDVLDYLKDDVYEIPTRFNSSGADTDKPLYFNFTWPFGENTTRVYYQDTGTQVSCKIEGDAIHWQSDLHDGDNDFLIRFANMSETMNCTGAFSTVNENQTIPWAQEKATMLLQTNIDAMVDMGYRSFKNFIGANRDFRVEINVSGSVLEFGRSMPSRSEVYLRTSRSQIFENSTSAEVSIWVW